MYRVVTISRQFGSGGRTIGRMAAEKLGYKFYDRELVNKVAAESGLSEKFIEDSGEYANSTTSLLFNLSLAGNYGSGKMSLYDEIYVAQCRIIKELAEQEPCVIVGRCADYILKDRDDCLNVFIHTDMKNRAERIVKLYGQTEKSPEKRLKEKDNKRKVYYKNYTGRNWGLVENYHLALDSACIGLERCAELIAEIAGK